MRKYEEFSFLYVDNRYLIKEKENYDGDMQGGNGTVGVFQLRRAVKLYDSNAKFVTVIPKDYFVSTKSGVSGQEYKSRMHITSYGYSGSSASGGFIELGDGGMTFDTFPLNWSAEMIIKF